MTEAQSQRQNPAEISETEEFKTLCEQPRMTLDELQRVAELRLKLSGHTEEEFLELSQRGQSGEVNDKTIDAMTWDYERQLIEAHQSNDQERIESIFEFGRQLVRVSTAHQWNQRSA